jgi:FKBP-type peptidyl-prolyl cis-trans isomerase
MPTVSFRLPLALPGVLVALLCAGCSPGSRTRDVGAIGSLSATQDPATMNANAQLQWTDLEPGSGPEVKAGQRASVHYTGWLYQEGAPESKGRKFDSSRDHGSTFEFRVGGGEVIKGWDLGVAGMQVGGKRRLVIPPELGYGSRGAGGVIPGGATLVFDVELVGIH